MNAPHSLRETVLVGAALLVLWGVSWGLSYAPLSHWSLAIALGIAALKAILVVVFFMELGRETASMRGAVTSAVLLVVLLIVFTLTDRATRAAPPLEAPGRRADLEDSEHPAEIQGRP